jgi:hypothetical protein
MVLGRAGLMDWFLYEPYTLLEMKDRVDVRNRMEERANRGPKPTSSGIAPPMNPPAELPILERASYTPRPLEPAFWTTTTSHPRE